MPPAGAVSPVGDRSRPVDAPLGFLPSSVPDTPFRARAGGVSWTLDGGVAAVLMHGAHKDTPHICADISISTGPILGRMGR